MAQLKALSPSERRSHVRGDIYFQVKFSLLSPEQYKEFKDSEGEKFSHSGKKMSVDLANGEKAAVDPSLINFLLHLDDKLDQILNLLNRDEQIEKTRQGLGVNISGSGMNILVNQNVEIGQIIHTKFLLSKYPLVFMDIFGEVVRCLPDKEKGEEAYHLGIQFLDMNLNDRERIISSVFQKQRVELRKKGRMVDASDE